MKKTSALILLLIGTLFGLIVFQSKSMKKAESLDESLARWKRESYEIVSHSDDPLVHDLFTGIFRADPILSVTAEHTPHSSEVTDDTLCTL